jgi:hypothetical protein
MAAAAMLVTLPLFGQIPGRDAMLTHVPGLQASGPQVERVVQPRAGGYKSVSSLPLAPLHDKYIEADERAQPITAHDKVVLGLEDAVTPRSFASMIIVSGYEQGLNGQPNYGTDRGAYGERLGAAALRESTQGIFTDAVFAPLLREDPRYYVQGQGHHVLHRTLYAITRPLITKTDSGKDTINSALLLGYASAAALSYTYYPSVNQNFRDTASTFGGSIGGAALGFVVSEFSSDVLQSLHLKKRS